MTTTTITAKELFPGSIVIGTDDNCMIFTGKLALQIWNGVVVQSIDADGTARIGPHTREQLEALAQ